MNTLFGDLAKRVAAFDPYKETIIAAKLAEDDIIAENISALYDSGQRADGTELGDYSKWTAARKEADGERFDHVTLRDTGRFYASMKVKFDEKSFRITADDKKVNDDGGVTYLTDEWGDEILGLRDEVLDSIIHNTIKPNMQAAFRAKILI